MRQASIYRTSFIGLGFITWLYLIARAYANPLVFDEATSYFLFIKNGTFWPGQAFWSANNHLLNSFLGYLSVSIFGSQEWALRLANILAFPLYAFFGFRLMRNLNSLALRWWALVLFFSTHGVLEFFGYARGYGLMLSFLLASLWFLREAFLDYRRRKIVYVVIFSWLALLSNIGCLPLVALIIFSALYLSWQAKQSRVLKLSLSLLATLPLAFALWWSLQLKSHQQLYYGGESSFRTDSLESLKDMVLSPNLSLDVFLAAGALFFIAILIGKPWKHYKNKVIAHWCVLVFLLITAFYPLGHWLIGLRFPFDRALIYWLVFGLIAKFIWLDYQYQVGRKSLVFFLSWSLVFPLLYFSQTSLNLASFESWAQEQIPNRYYKTMAKLGAESLGGTYVQAPQWNFLEQKFSSSLPVFQISDSPYLDFRLSENKDWPRWREQYKRIDSTETLFYLLQRKHPIEKELAASFQLAALEQYQANKVIYHCHDSLPADAISATLMIKTEGPPHKLAIALQVINQQGEQVHWQAFRARDYLSLKKGWQEWRLFVILKELAPVDHEIKLFIWNPESESFSLQESEWTLWNLK